MTVPAASRSSLRSVSAGQCAAVSMGMSARRGLEGNHRPLVNPDQGDLGTALRPKKYPISVHCLRATHPLSIGSQCVSEVLEAQGCHTGSLGCSEGVGGAEPCRSPNKNGENSARAQGTTCARSQGAPGTVQAPQSVRHQAHVSAQVIVSSSEIGRRCWSEFFVDKVHWL